MAGLGRGLGALLSASNRNKAKLSGEHANYGIVSRALTTEQPNAKVPQSKPEAETGREIHVSGQTSALNNLLSSKLPEPKSLKSRQFHSSRLNQNLEAQTAQVAQVSAPNAAVAAATTSSLASADSATASAAQTTISSASTLATPSALAGTTTPVVGKPSKASAEGQDTVRAVVVDAGKTTPPLKIAETNVVHTILLTNLKASVYQPRTDFSSESLQELAASIKEHGLLEPLLVTRSNEDPKSYEIICGERRYRAAQLAGLRAVPCLIRELSDEKAYAIALIENIQREDLSPLEIAKAYEQMMHQCKYTQESLAKSLGKSRSTVANTLRLLKLEPEVQKYLRLGDIDVGHAKILLALSGEHQIQAATTVVEQQLSVAATDVMVKELLSKLKAENEGVSKASTKNKALPRFNNYEKYLNKSLKGVKAKFVVKNENQGKLTLSYTSVSELEYLLKVLGIPGTSAAASATVAPAASEKTKTKKSKATAAVLAEQTAPDLAQAQDQSSAPTQLLAQAQNQVQPVEQTQTQAQSQEQNQPADQVADQATAPMAAPSADPELEPTQVQAVAEILSEEQVEAQAKMPAEAPEAVSTETQVDFETVGHAKLMEQTQIPETTSYLGQAEATLLEPAVTTPEGDATAETEASMGETAVDSVAAKL